MQIRDTKCVSNNAAVNFLCELPLTKYKPSALLLTVRRLLPLNGFIDPSSTLTMLYLLSSLLSFNGLIYTHIDTHFYFHCLWAEQWPRGRVRPATAPIPHHKPSLHDRPSVRLGPEPDESPSNLTDYVYFVREPLSRSHSLPSYFLLCRPLPLVFFSALFSLRLSCCLTFLTLLLLLQLFLAGSCMQWLSLPRKQKTLREERLEYRFIPQSSKKKICDSRSLSKSACTSGPWRPFKD